MEKVEYSIDFTDVTLNETDGKFKDVASVMKKEFPYDDNWVLRSHITVSSQGGMGVMEIQCHGDGSVYMLSYEPSIGELFYNPDIQVFSMWAQTNGWKIPQPHPDLIKTNKEFWKHFYDTLVIDSDYFDKLYGIRPQLEEEKSDKKRKKRD